MEGKAQAPVVVDITLPAAFPYPQPDDVIDSPLILKEPFRDLFPFKTENSMAFGSQMAAGVVSGAACSIVSYRIFKTKSVKAVFQSKSLSKDMTYLGALYGAAELSQQMFRGRTSNAEDDTTNITDHSKILDHSGVKNVALFGASVAAPLFHFWYRFLDARFVGTAPATLIKKVALDQLFASTSVSALFLVAIPAFQGDAPSVNDLLGPDSLLQRKFLSIYLTGCAFWPLAQIVNFRFVSPRYRVAYLGCAAFLWTNIMCFSRH